MLLNGELECSRLQRLSASQLNPFFQNIAVNFGTKFSLLERLMIQDAYDIVKLIAGPAYNPMERSWKSTTQRIFVQIDKSLEKFAPR